jgi:hypothetical protein
MERYKFQVTLNFSPSKNTVNVRFNVPGKRSYLFMHSNCTLMKYTTVCDYNIRRAAICLNLAGTEVEINEFIE